MNYLYPVDDGYYRNDMYATKRRPHLLVLDIYTTKFTHMNYWIETAKNGDEADIMLGLDTKYDVVLIDLMIPGITGEELIEKYPRHSYIVMSNMDTDILTEIYSKYIQVAGVIGKAQLNPGEICEVIEATIRKLSRD